jgi:hypothetical protein
MKYYFSILIFCLGFFGFAQNNLISTHTYYRDQLMILNRMNPYAGNGFLPVIESDYNLPYVIRDSSVLFTELEIGLLRKHMIELEGKDYFLTISAIGQVSAGRDLKDTTKANLFQNTRGILVKGDLFKNFSFSTSFFENQARFSDFESQFIADHGEMYTYWYGFKQQNGVVPGAARTKPFKTNGFDYAYAVGSFIYKPIKQLSIIVGNNQQFIGSGYRSVLLSDNSCGSPYLRLDYKLNSEWTFNYLRARHMNLVRKKTYTTVEGYYQPKGFSANYISYQLSKQSTISFFEGSTWSMGDSLSTRSLNPIFFIPIPGISALVSKNTYTIYGLNYSQILFSKYRIYAQFAVGSVGNNQFAAQVGSRFYNPGKLKNTMLQVEFNMATKNMYTDSYARLNYSNYNLPLAHIKGTGYKELLVRFNTEIQRYYFDVKSSSYFLNNYNNDALLPVRLASQDENGVILNNQVEIGFRFNTKLNVNIFGSMIWRAELLEVTKSNLIFQAGIRTGLMSTYNDY